MAVSGENQGSPGESNKTGQSSGSWKQHEVKLKFTFKEQREYETIDQDIADLEEKLQSLEEEIMANATNSGKLNQLMKEKEEAEAALEEKMDRWVYLTDLAEQIEAQKSV